MTFRVFIRFPVVPYLSRGTYNARICMADPLNIVEVEYGDKWIQIRREDVQIVKVKSIGELYGL